MSSAVDTALCVFIAVLCFGFLSARSLQDVCGLLPDVPYAIKPSGQASFPAGQELEYDCKSGYHRQGNRWIRCSFRQWEWVDPDRPFSCRIVRCAAPPYVSHGSYPGHNHTFGNVLTMKCDEGYTLRTNGLDHIICQPNGRWTVISAWCEEVTCRPLTAPQYGSMTLARGSSLLVVGTTYSFECDREHMLRGYQARDKMERKCRPDGSWDKVEAECIEMRCPVLDHLKNGTVRADDNLYGALASFDCNDGYDMFPPYSDNNKVTYCQRNGNWSVPLPKCKPNHCGPLPPQPNAIFDHGNRFSIGEKIRYECNDGYTYRGGPWIECTHDGWTWTAGRMSFYCQENCRPPGTMGVAHAKPIYFGSYPVNEVVNMACEEDYTKAGETELECTEQRRADGTLASPIWVWTQPESEMKCLEKCHDPTHIDNIKLSNERHDFGKVLTLECDVDYSPVRTTNNNRVQCTEGKRWSWLPSTYGDPYISCHANCRETPNVAHAIQSVRSFPIGHQIALNCGRGYIARGNDTLKCTTRGWSWIDNNNRFSCEKNVTPSMEVEKGGNKVCPLPALGVNEVYFYRETPLADEDDLPQGTTLKCVCSSPGEMFVEGYGHQVHTRDVQCLHDGTWEQCKCSKIPRQAFCSGLPFVRDPHCSVLQKGENITTREQLVTGEQVTINHLAGSIVVNRCANTYSAWVCRGGTWESVRPCLGYPQGVSKDNADISPNSTIETDAGRSIYVVPGTPVYTSSGSNWICDRNGNWSPTKFCQELPTGVQSSCFSLENGATVTHTEESWMAQSPIIYTYYTATSKISSNCSGTDQKWFCAENGVWQHWTNCDKLPTQLITSGTRLKLHSSEATDVTSWANGLTIKVECSTGFVLKTGTDDSWTCDRGTWTVSTGLNAPECARAEVISSSTFSRVQDQLCDTPLTIPNGSIVRGDYGNYDAGETAIEVLCDNGKQVIITCRPSGIIYDPDPSLACV